MTITTRHSGWKTAADRISEHLVFPESHMLLAHWRDIWPDPADRLPERRHIDPLAITKALQHVFLIEKELDGGRLRYCVAGEEINKFYDYRIVGKHLDEIVPDNALEQVDFYFPGLP